MNKERLVRFLRDFQKEKEDEQFMEEKAMLVETLEHLPDVASRTASTPAGAADAAHGAHGHAHDAHAHAHASAGGHAHGSS